MIAYSQKVEDMACVAQEVHHGAAPIPEEGKWVKSKNVQDISGLTHGVGWCAPQQGACKLTLNVKDGIIQEALVETVGCSGMTHSAAMAAEILPGLTVLEALNTDLVCDAINTAMRELSCRSLMAAARRRSPMTVCQSALASMTSAKACAARSVRSTARSRRARVTSNSQKAMSRSSLSTKRAASSATKSCSSAKSWKLFALARMPMRQSRPTRARRAASLTVSSSSIRAKSNSPLDDFRVSR